MKKPVVLVLVLLLTLLAAVPASAADQTRTETTHYFEVPVVDCTAYGYDFAIADHEVSTWTVTVFYDNAGNVTQRLWHDQGIDTYYNTQHPEVTLVASYGVMNNLEPLAADGSTWTLRAMGQPYRVHLPGGQLIHIAGQATVTVDAAGNWIEFQRFVGVNQADEPAFCAAMAG